MTLILPVEATMPAELVNPDGTPWTPAFPRQRAPWQPGNEMAVKHGVNSVKRVDPLAHSFRDEILSSGRAQFLNDPLHATIFWAWCRQAARVQLLEDYCDSMSMQQAADGSKGTTPPLELLRKHTATLLTLTQRLGLDPLSYARLGKDTASTQVDLARLLSDRSDESNKDSDNN